MKKLIILSTLLFSLNLKGMEIDNNEHQLGANNNLYFQNIMDSLQAVLRPTSNKIEYKNLDTDDFNEENFNLLREKFGEAVDAGNSHRAHDILNEALDNYPELSDDSQKIYINFVIKFLEIINLEKKIYKKNKCISEKKFQTLYNKFVCSGHELEQYIQIHQIELDDINMSNCAGFDTCLLLLAIKLSPSERMLNFLITNGITLNIADHYGNTPLHILTALPESDDTISMLNLLLDNGIDVGAINRKKNKPVDIARENENYVTAKILLLLPIKFSSTKCKDNNISNQDEFRIWASYNNAKKFSGEKEN